MSEDETREAAPLGEPGLDADLSALADGELDEARARELRARIAAEPRLAARLRAFEELRASVRALPAPALPADLEARLAARLAAETPSRMSRRAWRAPAFAAAAIAAALVLYLAVRRPPSPPEVPATAAGERVAEELAAASDEELAIALELELLADLEVIDRLEVLERLAILEEAEQG